MARPKKQTDKPNQPLTFYNKYNRHLYVEQKPTEYPPSETVQGQSMSMAEMIRAFTRGEIPPMAESAFHGYDVDMNQHDGVRPPQDITEVEELAGAVANDRTLLAELEATTSDTGASLSEKQGLEETSPARTPQESTPEESTT